MTYEKKLTFSKKGLKKKKLNLKLANKESIWSDLTLEQKRSIMTFYLGSLRRKEKKNLLEKLKNEIDIREDFQFEDITKEEEVLFDYIWGQMSTEAKQSLFESGVGKSTQIQIHGEEMAFHLTQILKPGTYRDKFYKVIKGVSYTNECCAKCPDCVSCDCQSKASSVKELKGKCALLDSENEWG